MALRRLRLSVACIALLVPMVAQCQPESTLWRFAYPNAKAVVSINWQRIRQSPAGGMIRDQWFKGGVIGAIPGIELLDDIDRVLISSPGNAPKSDANSDANTDADSNLDAEAAETPVLIAVQGHFDAVKVRQVFARLGAKAQSYNSFQVYRPQGKNAKDMAYMQFDAGTILFGDAPSIFAALERNRFALPAPEPGSIVARAAEMDSVYELWLSVSAPDILASGRLAELFHGTEWASDAQGFEAGVSLRAGLTADITVRAGSETGAQQVSTELTRLATMMSKDKQAGAPMHDIAKKLKFSADGLAIKISLRLTPQELEKSAQAFAAGYRASQQIADRATPAPPPVPDKPGVIRIEGLDEGTREIPYPEHH